MPDDFDTILDQAEELTLKELNSRISSLTRLKDSELDSIFPSKPEKAKLLQLMQIVRGAATENKKKAELIENIDSLAGTVLKLVGKFV